MEQSNILAVTFLAVSMGCGSAVQAAVDSDASLVYLRSSCTVNGAGVDNCFTDLNTLNSWIWNTRLPSASQPLEVEIRAGTFAGQFSCNNSGYVTLSGAGRDQTTITNASFPIATTGCTGLVFRQFTVENTATLLGV
jgi:hypothetical protein